MSKQIQIRNDLYNRLVEAKKTWHDRHLQAYNEEKEFSFSDILDELFCYSEFF